MELQKLVHTILENNNEMSRRLRAIETQTRSERANPESKSSALGTIDDKLTPVSKSKIARTQCITPTTSFFIEREDSEISLPSITKFNDAFDQDLKASRVYKRVAFRQSKFSPSSSATRSLDWSFFFGQNLANISNISALSLPITPKDLWNPGHYMTERVHPEPFEESALNVQADIQTVRIALLGNQASGKTTMLKQFNLLQEGGFSIQDRTGARPEIYQFVFGFLKLFLRQSTPKRISRAAFGSRMSTFREIVDAKSALLQMIENESPKGFLSEHTRLIRNLWQKCCTLRTSYPTSVIYENGPYYLNNIERLVDPDYLPTDQDILHLYTCTAGAYESSFDIDNHVYRVVNMGGARAERRKWKPHFSNADYLFYIVPLTRYAQTAFYGPGVQMDEALVLFESLESLPQIQHSTYVVIFTKLDIFKDKISDEPIASYFPDFNGCDRVDDALDYFKSRFKSNLISRSPERIVYFKYINTTDTNTLKEILEGLQQGWP